MKGSGLETFWVLPKVNGKAEGMHTTPAKVFYFLSSELVFFDSLAPELKKE